MFPEQGPAQISWFFPHDRYPMGLIQSLGFLDNFLTYASWFFENFQIQRTGVVA